MEAVIWFSTYFDLGRFGVILFFIISGYVIAHSILRYRDNNIRRFVLSRLFRLYPVYWLNIVVIIFLLRPDAPTIQIVANATMVQRYLGVPDINPVFWTLAIELAFYALVGLLYLTGVLARLRNLVVFFVILTCYAAAAAINHGQGGFYLPFGTPFFLTFMIGGSILRFVDEAGWQRKPGVWLGVALYFVALAIISTNFYRDPAEFNKTWQQDLVINGGALLLFLLVNYAWRVQWRPLAYLGVISYSIYLFHDVLGDWLVSLATDNSWDALLSPWSMVAILFALAIAGSSITYQLVERPFIGIGRQLTAKWLVSDKPKAVQHP